MKRFLCAFILYILFCQIAFASNYSQRYRDLTYREIKIDSIVYTTHGPRQLYMDVYQPVGDTASLRPLVIMAHGGSFMHGDRHAERIPVICRELAMRGFVAVSIDYRLVGIVNMMSKHSAYRSMIKAVEDGRNSVRWFINDAAHGNTYRVDTRKIFFGGSSAGAILAEQLAYIDSANECDAGLCKVVTKFLPDSGALPPHAIRGVISLAGAMLDTNLIGTNAPALLHIHGDADYVVPYGYKRPVNGLAPFKLAGLGGSRPRYVSQRLDYSEYVFKGEGHTPWDHDDKALKIVIEQIVDFLNKEIR